MTWLMYWGRLTLHLADVSRSPNFKLRLFRNLSFGITISEQYFEYVFSCSLLITNGFA